MSTPLTLPLVKVTLLEDRALVERRGEVSLAPGAQRVVIGGLPPVAVDRSLQAKVTGGTVAQARIRRTMRVQLPEALREQRTELGRRVAALMQDERRATADVQRLEVKQNLVRTAHDDVYRAIAEGTGAGQARPDAWREQLETARRELDATDAALREARRQEQRVRRQLEEARSALGRTEQPEPTMDIQAELEVSHGAGGTATLSLTYLVPCAAWRPAYRATLRSEEGGESVSLECEAVVWQRTGEEWKDVTLAFSTARPTLGASPPRLVEDWLWLREKSERERQVVEVSMREEAIQTTGEGAAKQASQDLPGMDDGGEPLTLLSPHRATVPSDGEPHRVPLFQFTAPARSELLACPELSPLVHRVARFDNPGPAVLLAGPVDLVRSSGYVGRAQLRFAGRNEQVKLGFGSEDALRVARTVDEEVDTNRLTGRRTRTQKVKLFVSNMGAKPEAVAIEERMPVSEVESVEVTLLKDATKPAPSRLSEDGIVRFELKAAPRSQQTLALAYTVSSASKVAGL